MSVSGKLFASFGLLKYIVLLSETGLFKLSYEVLGLLASESSPFK
jgi:hypothetical protein